MTPLIEGVKSRLRLLGGVEMRYGFITPPKLTSEFRPPRRGGLGCKVLLFTLSEIKKLAFRNIERSCQPTYFFKGDAGKHIGIFKLADC